MSTTAMMSALGPRRSTRWRNDSFVNSGENVNVSVRYGTYGATT